jgi:hypothetical protein
MTTPNDCRDSFIEIYERTTSLSDKSRSFCGQVLKDARSTHNVVYLRLFAKSFEVIPKFSVMFTTFTSSKPSESTRLENLEVPIFSSVQRKPILVPRRVLHQQNSSL